MYGISGASGMHSDTFVQVNMYVSTLLTDYVRAYSMGVLNMYVSTSCECVCMIVSMHVSSFLTLSLQRERADGKFEKFREILCLFVSQAYGDRHTPHTSFGFDRVPCPCSVSVLMVNSRNRSSASKQIIRIGSRQRRAKL
jgi:hypothetical protein